MSVSAASTKPTYLQVVTALEDPKVPFNIGLVDKVNQVFADQAKAGTTYHTDLLYKLELRVQAEGQKKGSDKQVSREYVIDTAERIINYQRISVGDALLLPTRTVKVAAPRTQDASSPLPSPAFPSSSSAASTSLPTSRSDSSPSSFLDISSPSSPSGHSGAASSTSPLTEDGTGPTLPLSSTMVDKQIALKDQFLIGKSPSEFLQLEPNLNVILAAFLKRHEELTDAITNGDPKNVSKHIREMRALAQEFYCILGAALRTPEILDESTNSQAKIMYPEGFASLFDIAMLSFSALDTAKMVCDELVVEVAEKQQAEREIDGLIKSPTFKEQYSAVIKGIPADKIALYQRRNAIITGISATEQEKLEKGGSLNDYLDAYIDAVRATKADIKMTRKDKATKIGLANTHLQELMSKTQKYIDNQGWGIFDMIPIIGWFHALFVWFETSTQRAELNRARDLLENLECDKIETPLSRAEDHAAFTSGRGSRIYNEARRRITMRKFVKEEEQRQVSIALQQEKEAQLRRDLEERRQQFHRENPGFMDQFSPKPASIPSPAASSSVPSASSTSPVIRPAPSVDPKALQDRATEEFVRRVPLSKVFRDKVVPHLDKLAEDLDTGLKAQEQVQDKEALKFNDKSMVYYENYFDIAKVVSEEFRKPVKKTGESAPGPSPVLVVEQ